MSMNQAQQQPRLMPPPSFGLPFSQPNAQQMINNQQLITFMNMMNASAAMQTAPVPQPVKAGGSITAGSSSFSNLPQTAINLPGTSSIGPGGIGIHPQQLGVLNGLATSNTSASSPAQNDPTRHKIHELKTGENPQAALLGVNNLALQQQQRNASPNSTNVITSASNIPRGKYVKEGLIRVKIFRKLYFLS